MKTDLFVVLAALGLGAAPAFAGDLSPAQIDPQPVAAAPAPQSAVDWGGFYLGASVARNTASVDSLAYGNQTGEHKFDADNSGAALHLGYNFALANKLVLGVELSRYAGDMVGTGRSAPNAPDATQQIDNMTTLRLRAGMQIGRALPYIAVGAAKADSTRHTEYRDQTAGNKHEGSVVAAGVEWAMTEHLSLRAEYQHFDLGAEIYDFGRGNDPKVKLTGDTVHVGVNVRF